MVMSRDGGAARRLRTSGRSERKCDHTIAPKITPQTSSIISAKGQMRLRRGGGLEILLFVVIDRRGATARCTRGSSSKSGGSRRLPIRDGGD